MSEARSEFAAQRRLVIAAFVSHWFMALLVQVESVWIYSNVALLDHGRWFELAAAQSQNVVIAGVLAALGWVAGRRPWSRYGFVALVSLANLHVALNILSIKIFSQHFRFSFIEGPLVGGGALWDSMLYEIDGVVYFNLIVASLSAGVLFYFAVARTIGPPRPLGAATLSVIGLASAAFSAGLWMSIDAASPLHKLRIHPLIALVDDRSIPSIAVPANISDKPVDLGFWSTMVNPQNSADADALVKNASLIRASEKMQNVILVVLESVGSLQLFPNDGRADSRITPHIAAMQSSAVLFDSLYSPFPGTVRSHVALATGGDTITWGSVFHELSYPYSGPTINRSLAALGFGTGLFSSQHLDFENMDGFYGSLNWDHLYEFGQLSESDQERYRLSSWGGEEFNTLDRMFTWIEAQDHTRPFFAQYLNVATHHPYTAPEGYPGPAGGDDRISRYQNALHYTDRVIAELAQRLEKLNLDRNTVIAITGDHGQAFADRHANNLTHKNFLYEENIRNFLFMYHPAWNDSAVVSHRVASIGSIRGTLRNLAGPPEPELEHDDLFGPSFAATPVFFFKNAYPEKWGLRYGKWKYIATRDDSAIELYDLEADPTEQQNLADQHRPHLGPLRAAVQQWYLQTNDRFVAQLKDYHYIGGRGFQVSDLNDFGPKIVAVGHEVHTPEGTRFVEQDAVNPRENVVVWTKWLGYPYDKTFSYRFSGPNGELHEFSFEVKEEWSTTRVKYDGAPMAEGIWRVELWDGDRKLIEKSYRADGAAPLYSPLGTDIEVLESALGSYTAHDRPHKETFFVAGTLRQTQIPVLWSRWRKFTKPKKLTFQWESPGGAVAQAPFEIQQGWDQSWVHYEGRLPLEAGQWGVRVIDPASRRTIVEKYFTVVPSH